MSVSREFQIYSVLLKNFGAYATGLSDRVRDAAHAFARRRGRPVRYLYSTAERKDTLARQLAERDRIRKGLIGVFDCVEPCLTYFVRGDRQAHRLELKLESGKCLHHYFYFEHPEFGLMHLRLQTWFPSGDGLRQWPAVARATARPHRHRLYTTRQQFRLK